MFLQSGGVMARPTLKNIIIIIIIIAIIIVIIIIIIIVPEELAPEVKLVHGADGVHTGLEVLILNEPVALVLLVNLNSIGVQNW